MTVIKYIWGQYFNFFCIHDLFKDLLNVTLKAFTFSRKKKKILNKCCSSFELSNHQRI